MLVSVHRASTRLPLTLLLFSTSSPWAVKKRMPPKKSAAPEKKILLGRPSNNLKIGIVGQFSLPIRSHLLPFIHPYFFLKFYRSAQCWKIFIFQCTLRNRYVANGLSNTKNLLITLRSRESRQFSIRNDKPRGGSYTCPRCPLRVALRHLQTRLPCPGFPHLHRYCRSYRRAYFYLHITHAYCSFRVHRQARGSATLSYPMSVPSMASFRSSVHLMMQRSYT